VAATDAQQQNQAQGYFNGGGNATPAVAGAIVQQASGPAAAAGVRQGDVLTAVDGQAIGGRDDLLTALAQRTPGDTVTLTLNRNGDTLTVRVRLGELPAS